MADGSYSYDVVGMWEDITDIITNISPDDTPLLTMFGNKPAKATTVTSLNDALPTADSTPIVEGADVTPNAVLARTKVDNYVQIFDSKFYLTDTQIATVLSGWSLGAIEALLRGERQPPSDAAIGEVIMAWGAN